MLIAIGAGLAFLTLLAYAAARAGGRADDLSDRLIAELGLDPE